ncbi:MAG: asparagine synthase (glutamine-hydrolyzing) [Bacteroidota bacterium]
MCGICGVYDSFGRVGKDRLKETVIRMNEAIVHRGPDDFGFYHSAKCSLAMRRLAIIDLEHGKQPIFNDDSTLCIFFNGEIYNYLDLKEILLAKGYKFKTASDTEVIIKGYEEWGEDMPQYLRGMFAFCILDIKRDKLFLARDRFGEKPLYYHLKDGILSFSSEIDSLLKNNSIPRRLNHESLKYYLASTLVPEPYTMLKDVMTLPVGCCMTLEKGEVQIKKYFSINYQTDNSLKTKEDVVEMVSPILDQAVKRQMVSDVPIGSFLSGGIDSSTVVAKLSQLSENPVKTFTVKFEAESHDESKIAKETAQHLDTNHHEIFIPKKEFSEDLFWDLLEHTGLPFPDTSLIPSYLLTQEIRKHVKVALSGDGGDELFGGYDIFQWWQKITKFSFLPRGLSSLIGQTLTAISGLDIGVNDNLRRLRKGFEVLSQPEKLRFLSMNMMFSMQESKRLFKEPLKFDYKGFANFPPEFDSWTPLRQIMYYRMMHDLPLAMLTKVDRASMANSLEVRAPFLDVDLFEASSKIPDTFLINEGKGKYIIREIMKPYLPAIVFDHPKRGFGMPIHNNYSDNFRNLVRSLFESPGDLKEIFDFNHINDLWQEALVQKKDTQKLSLYRSSNQIWSLMQLVGWIKKYNVEI